MPHQMDVLEATRLIRQELPQTHLLLLTDSTNNRFANLTQLISAGVSGCLDKAIEPDELVEAIKTVIRGAGGLVFSPEIALQVFSPGTAPQPVQTRTQVQVQVQPTPVPQTDPSSFFPAKTSLASNSVRLTERKAEVLKSLAQGKTNREIAQALGLSEKTIKVHLSNLLSKLDKPSRTALALYGVQLLTQEAEAGS